MNPLMSTAKDIVKRKRVPTEAIVHQATKQFNSLRASGKLKVT